MKTKLNKAVALVLVLLTIGVLLPYVRPPVPVVQQIDQQVIDQIVEQVVLKIEPSIIGLASVHFGELAEVGLGTVQGNDLLVIDHGSGPTTSGITLTALLSNTVPITAAGLTSTDAISAGTTLDVAGIATFSSASLHSGNLRTAYLLDIGSNAHLEFVNAGRTATGNSSSTSHGLSTDDFQVDGNLEVEADAFMDLGLTVAGPLTATTWVTVGTFLKLSAPVAEQTITNGTADIAPAGSYHEIGAGGSVANTMSVTGYDQGDTVRIVNVSAQTITITDTGTTMLSATFAMAQYDTLTLLFDGTNWLETGRSNN